MPPAPARSARRALFGVVLAALALAARAEAPRNGPVPPLRPSLAAKTPSAHLIAPMPAAIAPPARVTPRPRPDGTADCTPDARHCIDPRRRVRDTCRVIWATAREAGLEAGVFARLIWRESLFDPDAVSPAGALGIAQFIPETADRRGLADPFNPAAALHAAALYLADLARGFGNIGLAAAAYNGGEARLARFLDGTGGLPRETRAYVHAVTGHPVEVWQSEPPGAPDFTLVPGTPFLQACEARARARAIPLFTPPDALMPWQVIVAAHPDRDVAEAQADRVWSGHGAMLGPRPAGLRPVYLPGRRMPFYTAGRGFEMEDHARLLCTRLRKAGAGCMVLRR